MSYVDGRSGSTPEIFLSATGAVMDRRVACQQAHKLLVPSLDILKNLNFKEEFT